jgi:AcrR family transcriptional regulator
MARQIKPEEHAARRNEILDVVQRLVYDKGFEQLTIQDILADRGISKGAFYHYFDSKQAVLEAMVERILDAAEQVLRPVVDDPALPATAKLQRFFDTAARWKAERKDYLLAVFRGWYGDDNAIVRAKVQIRTYERVGPLLAAIFKQGNREGVFNVAFPDQAGQVVMALNFGLGETMGRWLLRPGTHQAELEEMERLAAAYTDALERVLGAPPGSVHLVDAAALQEWFSYLEKEPA